MGEEKENGKPEAITTPQVALAGEVDAATLFERVAAIIENRKYRAGALANREVTLMNWEIGQYIGSVLLGGERPEWYCQESCALFLKPQKQPSI
jgi:hypothetical protein